MRDKRLPLAVLLVLVLALATGTGAFASFFVQPQVPLPGGNIDKYVDEIPRPPRVDSTNLFVSMNEFQQKLLSSTFQYPPEFADGTFVWGFGASDGCGNIFPPSYPGPTIVAHRVSQGDPRGPTQVHYENLLAPKAGRDHLVLQEYLTVDQTLHWANPLGNTSMVKCMNVDCTDPSNQNNPCCLPYLGPVPVTVHLHGAETPSAFDGHPESWWTPGLQYTGPAFVSTHYTYPNTQEPTTLWYHDHALGMTRTNIYSGLAAFYLLRGQGDTGMPDTGLNLPVGGQELEVLIADRQFDTNGQLLFPDGFPEGLNGPPPNPNVHPFWNPEFFGDTVVVNGKTWPKMTVKPERYRFRLLNGSNARFFNLSLGAGGLPNPDMWVIATDGGFLDKPVKVDSLLMGPSERYQVIIDFSKFAGRKVWILNDAPAPFPSGSAPDISTVGQVMQFQVGKTPVTDTTFDPAAPGATLRGKDKPLAPIVRLVDGNGGLAPGVNIFKKRQLVMIEMEGPGGPIEVLLNNTKWNGKRFGIDTPVPGSMPLGAVNITELPVVGSTELWEIINLTGDAHPIHVHDGQFQLMNRQAFDTAGYTSTYNLSFPGHELTPEYGPPMPYDMLNADGALGGNPAVSPFLIGPVIPPKPYEFGWKDVWVMPPGQVTRIVLRFSPQNFPVDAVSPGQNLYAFDPTARLGTTDSFGFPGGPGYVWHCHILDHEDNEMMRPYIPVNLSQDTQ